MDNSRFDSLISRLEVTARDYPQKYLASVLGIALLGFVILGIAILFALLPAVLLVGVAALVVLTGGKALIFLFKLGKLMLLLILPAWVMVKASMQMLFARFPAPQGRELERHEAPQLFARIDELRRTMKGPPIHHVLLKDELNAGINQHPRFGLFGWEHNYLILGLPLLQTLSEAEALSVVAHEYGHLSGHHDRFGGFIYRFRAAWGRMQDLSDQWTDWGSRMVSRLFRWYAPYFNAYTFVLARQDEYAADRVSVEVAGAHNAATALMRVNVAARFEDEVFWPSVTRLVATLPEPLGNRSSFWHQSLRDKLDEPTRQRYLDAARQRETDYLDTHPALSDRLRAIGGLDDETAARNLVPPSQSAAQAWLGASLAEIEAEFDENWRKGAAERWQERHRHLDECRQSLDKLQAKPEHTIDDRWEIIRLTREVTPDLDRLPLLNALLAEVPAHASALYERGTLLLERGDEAGVADLERLMEKDADAILASCEAAWRFYCECDPERAEQFRQRWLARSDYEDRVQAESQKLDTGASLEPHGLDFGDEDKIRQLVEAHGRFVRRAYLLRRVYKSDPALHDYVLAIETGGLFSGDKGTEMTKVLARQEFPVSTFIVHLGSDPYKAFRKTIKQLGISPLIAR